MALDVLVFESIIKPAPSAVRTSAAPTRPCTWRIGSSAPKELLAATGAPLVNVPLVLLSTDATACCAAGVSLPETVAGAAMPPIEPSAAARYTEGGGEEEERRGVGGGGGDCRGTCDKSVHGVPVCTEELQRSDCREECAAERLAALSLT